MIAIRVPAVVPFALLLAAATPLAAQTKPAPPVDSAAIARQLDKVYATFSDAYTKLDVAAVAGLYAPNALYLAPGEPPLEGGEAIRATFARYFDGVRKDGNTLSIEFKIVRREIAPGLATDVGYYRLATVRDGKPGKPSVGRFVTVLRQDAGGRWRFVLDSYAGTKPEEFP